MVNDSFKSVPSNPPLSDSAKCILVACAILCTLLIAAICMAIPFLAFVACAYAGWELSWKLIAMLLVSWRDQS